MPGHRCKRWCNAPLLSLCILYLHRVPGTAPAAGSCCYAAAGNFCGNSGREARLDYRAVDTVALHLHSIADAEHVPSIVDPEAAGTGVEVRVEKKNKKRFDKYNNMGYKGSIN